MFTSRALFLSVFVFAFTTAVNAADIKLTTLDCKVKFNRLSEDAVYLDVRSGGAPVDGFGRDVIFTFDKAGKTLTINKTIALKKAIVITLYERDSRPENDDYMGQVTIEAAPGTHDFEKEIAKVKVFHYTLKWE